MWLLTWMALANAQPMADLCDERQLLRAGTAGLTERVDVYPGTPATALPDHPRVDLRGPIPDVVPEDVLVLFSFIGRDRPVFTTPQPDALASALQALYAAGARRVHVVTQVEGTHYETDATDQALGASSWQQGMRDAWARYPGCDAVKPAGLAILATDTADDCKRAVSAALIALDTCYPRRAPGWEPSRELLRQSAGGPGGRLAVHVVHLDPGGAPIPMAAPYWDGPRALLAASGPVWPVPPANEGESAPRRSDEALVEVDPRAVAQRSGDRSLRLPPNVAKGVEGPWACEVTVQIDATGAPALVQVGGCPEAVRPHVQELVEGWRWWPYKVDGRASPARFVITFRGV